MGNVTELLKLKHAGRGAFVRVKTIAPNIIGTIALAMCAASIAHAEDKLGNFGVNSIARPICAFRAAPIIKSQDNISLDSVGTNASSLHISDLVDTETAYLRRASVHISMPAVCNSAFFVSITTLKGRLEPLVDANVTAGIFLQHINYRARVEWGSQNVTLVADGTPGKSENSGHNSGPFWGDLEINVHIDGENNAFDVPVVANTYSDTLIVQIGALL